MTWMQTRSGRRFRFDDIESNHIEPSDVAWSLGHTCRFAGHCRRFYSVAEHTLLMVHLLNSDVGMFDVESKFVVTGQILVHDAHEAYVGDMTRPLKAHIGDAWRLIEEQVENHVRASLGVSGPRFDDWSTVSRLDAMLLAAEARELMTWPPERWDIPDFAADTRLTIGEPIGSPERMGMLWIDAYNEWRKGLANFGSSG